VPGYDALRTEHVQRLTGRGFCTGRQFCDFTGNDLYQGFVGSFQLTVDTLNSLIMLRIQFYTHP
jgi:hypothetical protein